MKKYKYELIVLLSSIAIMILELTATRILSPYVGTSNIVWTSIIGIILASMAIGYYLGGILADKKPKTNILGLIILISAIYISLIPLLEVTLINKISLNIESLKISSILCSIILFMIPSILLAMVYPFCMKLKEITQQTVGLIAGKLSFFSTIGSIIGTFTTGFWLLPLLGNRMILMVLSISLIVISFLIIKKNIKLILLIIICILVSLTSFYFSKNIYKTNNPNVLLDKDTEYSRAIVAKLDDDSRELVIGNRRQSLSNDNLSQINYYNYFDLMDELNPELENVLLIGGGGYSYPKNFLEQHKDKKLDVVEIDPELVEIAKEYFNYEENSNITNYFQDGRTFLNQNKKKYDVILLDAYEGVTPPFQLVTVEALEKVKESLTENGVVISNIMGATEGEKSLLLKAEYLTYNEVFDKVLFLTNYEHNQTVRTNIFIAFKNYDESKINYDNVLFDNIIDDFEVEEALPILTDDYAPVEYYTSKY